MKKLFMIILSCLSFNHAFSQDNKVEINLGKHEMVIDQIMLGSDGFILQIGSPSYELKYGLRYPSPETVTLGKRKSESILKYFDASFNLVWEEQLKNNYPESNSYMIASPNGSYIYYIEIKDKIYRSKAHYITQINKKGEVKKFELPGKKEFGKKLQAVFNDDEYLYYLTTEDGNEGSDKKKTSEKLILNRFNNSNLSHKKILIEVPALKDGKNETYWSFIGQKDNENYLLSKFINKESGKSKFNVVSFDQSGKIVKNFAISLDLQNNFLRPGFNIKARKGYEAAVDLDFENKIRKSASAPNMPTTYSSKNYILNGGFSYLTFDPDREAFYAYGLFGSKPFKAVGPVYEGFYIFKFDLNGNKIWELKQLASKELMDEGIFRVHGTPADREIYLKVFPDQSLNFSIHFRKTLFSHEVSRDGKVHQIRQKEKYFPSIDNMVISSKNLKSEEYIETKHSSKNKDIYFSNDLLESGEILMEMDLNVQKLRIMYFNNKL